MDIPGEIDRAVWAVGSSDGLRIWKGQPERAQQIVDYVAEGIRNGFPETEALAMAAMASGSRHRTARGIWRLYCVSHDVGRGKNRKTHCQGCGMRIADNAGAVRVYDFAKRPILMHAICLRLEQAFCSIGP